MFFGEMTGLSTYVLLDFLETRVELLARFLGLVSICSSYDCGCGLDYGL